MTADVWADLRATTSPDHPDLGRDLPDNTAHESAAEEIKWAREHDGSGWESDHRADVEDQERDRAWGE